MKLRPIFRIALAAGFCAMTCAAQQDAASKPAADKTVFHVAVDLDDGSHLVGTLPADTRIAVQSPDLKTGIAIKWIDTITMSGDHKTAVIAMQNGDQIKVALTMKILTLAMDTGEKPVDLRFIKTVSVFEPDDTGTQGLVFWNTLASEKDALHSAVGPGLVPYAGKRVHVGDMEVVGRREFITENQGGAVTLKGTYAACDLVHNLVLGGLGKLIDPGQGCIEFWYCQMERPVPFHHGVYRMFDGDYGLGSCAQFFAMQEGGLTFALNCGGKRQMVSIPEANTPVKEWIHLAASWNRKGIEGTKETIRLYLNGKQVASSTATNWGTVPGGEADICGGQDAECAGKFYMNNLKIWNRAKTNFDLTEKPDIVPRNMPPPVPPPPDNPGPIRMPKTVVE